MKNYKEFYGSNLKQMKKLLAKGFIPVSVAEIMKHRLNNKEFFINKYFDTSDLFADSKKNSNNLKFILTVNNQNKITDKGREALELICHNNKLFEGTIDLTDKYDSLKGRGVIKVSRKEIGKVDEYLTKDEILGSKIWRILARHPNEVPKEFAEDEKLLGEYSKWIQAKTKDPKNMKIYIDPASENSKLGVWCIGESEIWSPVYAWDDLDNNNGRFLSFRGKL